MSGRAAQRWVFKRGRELFGPVPTETLEGMLRAGEIGPDTLVAREQGPFAPIGAVEPFVGIAAEVAAAGRERAEAKRRRRRMGLGLVAIAILGGAAAFFLGARDRATLERRELRAISIEVLPMVVRAVDFPPDAEEFEWEPPRDVRRSAPARQGEAPRRAAPAASRETRTPSAAPDELAIETHFDAAAIERVVARNRARLLPCIRARAEADPTFRGELPLAFVVGNDGRVSRLWVERVGLRQGALHDCLLGELRRWEFPSFEGQSPAISLRFHVGE